VRFPAAVVERYFPGVEAVAVLIDGAILRILPIHHVAAGGCLLKQCNLAGDRVAAAFDVFEHRGLGTCVVERLAAQWSSTDAALIAELPEEMQTKFA
jgi:hypothetical protein